MNERDKILINIKLLILLFVVMLGMYLVVMIISTYHIKYELEAIREQIEITYTTSRG